MVAGRSGGGLHSTIMAPRLSPVLHRELLSASFLLLFLLLCLLHMASSSSLRSLQKDHEGKASQEMRRFPSQHNGHEEDERKEMDKEMDEKENEKEMEMEKGKIPYRPLLSKPPFPYPSKTAPSLLSPALLKALRYSLREVMTEEGEEDKKDEEEEEVEGMEMKAAEAQRKLLPSNEEKVMKDEEEEEEEGKPKLEGERDGNDERLMEMEMSVEKEERKDEEKDEENEREKSSIKSEEKSDEIDTFMEMEMGGEEDGEKDEENGKTEQQQQNKTEEEDEEEFKSEDKNADEAFMKTEMRMNKEGKVEKEEEEKEEREKEIKKSLTSAFHLPPLLNVIHDFRYPTVRTGVEGEQEVLQDGQPMDTRPLRLRAEASGSSSGGGEVCGRVFTELSGLITSPDFPFNYPNNAQCAYYISLPSQYTIALDCNDFSIQPGDRNCENDYLLITEDGQVEGEGVTKYCGDKALALFSSSSNMTLLFHADNSYRYRGFTCRYRAINPDGTGAVPAVITNTTEEHHTVLCTGPGNDGWSGKCGVAGGPGATRVVGGQVVAKHQFPWMVAVLKVCGREEQHYCNICGGTVISPSWVLTGAHCVVSIPVEKLGLLLGDHNLYTLMPSQKFFLVDSVYIHPDFNTPSPLSNDLALALLPQEMAFNSYVAPICLPPRNYDSLLELLPDATQQGSSTTTAPSPSTTTTAAPARRNAPAGVWSRQEGDAVADTKVLHDVLTGRNVSVYGWGIIDDDETPAQQLRGVSIEVLDNSVCRYYYGDLVTDLMMCTSGEGGSGPCGGDSGSPVQIQMVDGRWVQVGILAFGAAVGCEAGYPSGNILLPPYISWIEGVTDLDFGSDY